MAATALTADFNSVDEVKKSIRMFFVGTTSGVEKPIAYSTSAGLSFSKDDVDTANKMDGDWGTTLGGKKSAELSAESFSAPSNTTGYGESDFYDAWNNDTPLYFKYVYVTVTEKAEGGTTVTEDLTKPYYTGRVKISSMELTSDNGDVCKYSVSGTSQGAVTKHAGTPAQTGE